ncbi:phospholipase C, phosphocholine-specific [Caulobacter sp. SSI4214]|uniref:phosphocholine-specific phospholipase C n=1 Tax=Caulobacter sp. SSI4214 TaxID=2575739 RepID=UPI00143A61BD|nr:phospholipase C, phosphocholine-specific [Caulobacter sp. SSI4214]
MSFDRRAFLKTAAGGLGVAALATLNRALATPAHHRTGTIRDVEHVVILTQENRAFDHYFGTLPGVRGFGDPRPLRLLNGQTVWRQPSDQHPDGFVQPFHADSRTANAYVVDGADQHHTAATLLVNGGRYDHWGESKQMDRRMAYYTAADLPFYHALASSFTVLDAYHCSTLTQTYPNRMHMMTGCNGGGAVGGDPVMTNYGHDETPWADMAADQPITPYAWTTYPERLEKAGVSWKVYQEYDNYCDNILSVFAPYRPCPRDSNLYRRGRAWVSEGRPEPDRSRSDGTQLVEAFRRDIASGQLPQVSWIVTAQALSEHPEGVPAAGEHLTARLIAALVEHPEVFSKTVFMINYDEAGGFYDHMPPPMPPADASRGHSGVSVAGEFKDYSNHPHPMVRGVQPIGMGIRVPAIIVSPWTRGGYVCSQLFDHTSTLIFLEKRFGVREPNISPWRRAVAGDLTACFDFKTPNAETHSLGLPDTADYLDRIAHAARQPTLRIPATQVAAVQDPARRLARALPYRLAADGGVVDGRFRVTLVNQGEVGAVFTLHDYAAYAPAAPRHYTLTPGERHVADLFAMEDVRDYDLVVHGPNGFYRRFRGHRERAGGLTAAVSETGTGGLAVQLRNDGAKPLSVTLTGEPAYPFAFVEGAETAALPPGGEVRLILDPSASDHWYAFRLTHDADKRWSAQFAGHVETGRVSRTDPGIGKMVLNA